MSFENEQQFVMFNLTKQSNQLHIKSYNDDWVLSTFFHNHFQLRCQFCVFSLVIQEKYWHRNDHDECIQSTWNDWLSWYRRCQEIDSDHKK
jgi:hypothetical protein